jgi:hypothetical protein
VKIPHPEGGENGVSAGVVNQWLLWEPVDFPGLLQIHPRPRRAVNESVVRKHQSGRNFNSGKESF